MRCKCCKKDFEETEIKESPIYEPIKGVKYGMTTYTHTSKCPNCGTDNSPLVIFQ